MKEMISCISQLDIRTPLTSISGYIEMLSHAEEQDIPRDLCRSSLPVSTTWGRKCWILSSSTPGCKPIRKR